MATTGRSTDAASDPDRAATLVRDADFLMLLGSEDGAALAAVGIIGAALDDLGVPYQASLVPSSAAAETRLVDEGLAVTAGLEAGDLALSRDTPALAAYDVATALGADPDPVLAIAGAVAGGTVPNGAALEAATASGVERRPGVGIPTEDLAVGLAYSGLLHADFSGDEEAARSFVDALDADADTDAARTRLASMIGIEVSDAAGGSQGGLERVLAPMSSPGPFETIEGYADVLSALAQTDPGTGIAFVLGHASPTDALESWKTAGAAIHRGVVSLDLSRVGDVAVGTVDGVTPVPVARLARDFRVSDPNVLVGNGEAVALATTERDARSWLTTTFDDRLVTGGPDLAVVTEADDPTTVAERLQEDG
jgi:hypothetical protein